MDLVYDKTAEKTRNPQSMENSEREASLMSFKQFFLLQYELLVNILLQLFNQQFSVFH